MGSLLGGADQGDDALFDRGQQRILLGLGLNRWISSMKRLHFREPLFNSPNIGEVFR